MKKLIIFCLLLVATAGAQTDSQTGGQWEDGLRSFRVAHTGAGYMDPDEFVAFLNRAEGVEQESVGFFQLFFEDPVVFFERFGLGWTLLLILVGGLALNLTPCVLPMIPVNLAIIGAGAQSASRKRGFALGATYGLGITMVYGLLGVVVLLGGARFGSLNASPWFNIGIALVFLVLSLAMFNIFHIDLTKFHQHLNQRQVNGEFFAAFSIGGISALLAGACVAPVVLAVLLLAGNLYVLGITAGLILPFVLGLGMALPWPFAGAGLSFLPKPGQWMEWVKRGFGVLILLMALYYGLLGSRLLMNRAASSSAPVAPGEHLILCDGANACFLEALREASADGKPVFIDFWADWCKNCHAMDKTTLTDTEVLRRLERYRVIKFDATASNQSPAKEVLDHFEVKGLPTYIILEPIDD